MPNVHIHMHFRSPTLRIDDVCCRGTKAENTDGEQAFNTEIVFPRRGAFVRRDAFGTVVADPHQILFFHRAQPYQISHPISGGDRCTLFTLSESVLLDMLGSFDASVHDRQDKPFPVGAYLLEPRFRFAHYRLLYIADHQSLYDPLWIEEQILLFLGNILCPIFADHPKPPHVAGSMKQEIIDRVKLVLNEDFRTALKLDQIAQVVHSSPYWLCRIFKAETGISIHQYIQRMRLLYALEQVYDCPGESLAEIALQAGFYSHSHFTSSFVQTFGIPPSGFRKGTAWREMSKILKV